MRLFTLALAAAAALTAVAADAATYKFLVTDPDATLGGQAFSPYYFYLDSSPTPAAYDATSFTIDGTTYGSTIYGNYSVFDTFTFYNDAYGGFSDLENIYLNPVLFTGSTDHPTFKLGTFALDNFGSGASITISEVLPSVPEPASWAMMLAGFGAIGVVLRRRERGAVATA